MQTPKLLIAFLLTVVPLGAQSAPPTPIQAKRLPPEKTKAKQGTSLLDRYDFGAQVETLQEGVPATTTHPAASPITSMPQTGESTVPPGYKPKTDVQLTKTAQEAVQMSEKWMAEHNQPV